ncbi:MAG: alkaline phosphatase family protein [Armatimonadota bacterium]
MTSSAPPLPSLASTVAQLLQLPAPHSSAYDLVAEVVAELVSAPRVALLAPDALGRHPFDLWRHEMPFLSGLHDRRSLTLRAIMPSITPVNFAGMVSGAELPVHGIQRFTDDFKCETLFDVVRASGGVSGGVGQEGYTGGELLGRFADLWGRAESKTDDEVVEITLKFAQEKQPQFLIVQLGQTDDVFHKHGPSSPEVVPVVRATDERLRRMVGELQELGYAILITADHGQHDADGGGGTHGSDADEDCLVPLTWVG